MTAFDREPPETERLVLRGWREADRRRFVEIVNTPRMMEHMGGVRPLLEIDDLFDRQMAMQRSRGHCMWAMEKKATGLVIGICGLRFGGHPDTPVSDELEIGWRVAEHAWGKGYAREAAEASLAWGWKNTDRPRIAAWTVPANGPSWGLMVRLGMNRRLDLDFNHPRFEDGHPLQGHITFVVERPERIARVPTVEQDALRREVQRGVESVKSGKVSRANADDIVRKAKARRASM